MSAFSPKIPTAPGSYLLWLYLPRKTQLNVGKLGSQAFWRGWYGYSGRAFGPGGLRGRLIHHLRPANRPHWHIDYLRAHARLRSIWIAPELDCEHRWPQQLATHPAVTQPIAGFGSSDCHCFSHLVFLPSKPLLNDLQALLEEQNGLKISAVCKAEE